MTNPPTSYTTSCVNRFSILTPNWSGPLGSDRWLEMI